MDLVQDDHALSMQHVVASVEKHAQAATNQQLPAEQHTPCTPSSSQDAGAGPVQGQTAQAHPRAKATPGSGAPSSRRLPPPLDALRAQNLVLQRDQRRFALRVRAAESARAEADADLAAARAEAASARGAADTQAAQHAATEAERDALLEQLREAAQGRRDSAAAQARAEGARMGAEQCAAAAGLEAAALRSQVGELAKALQQAREEQAVAAGRAQEQQAVLKAATERTEQLAAARAAAEVALKAEQARAAGMQDQLAELQQQHETLKAEQKTARAMQQKLGGLLALEPAGVAETVTSLKAEVSQLKGQLVSARQAAGVAAATAAIAQAQIQASESQTDRQACLREQAEEREAQLKEQLQHADAAATAAQATIRRLEQQRDSALQHADVSAAAAADAQTWAVESDKTCQELQAELEQLKAQKDSADQKLAELKIKRKLAGNEASTAKRNNASLNKDLSKIRRQLDRETDRAVVQKAAAARGAEKVARLQRELATAEAETASSISKLSARVSELQAEVGRLKTQSANDKKAVKEAQCARAVAEQALTSALAAVDKAKAEKKAAENAMAEARAQQEPAAAGPSSAAPRGKRQRHEQEQQQEPVGEAQEAAGEAEAAVDSTSSIIADLRAQLAAREAAKQRAAQEAADVRLQLAAMAKERDDLLAARNQVHQAIRERCSQQQIAGQGLEAGGQAGHMEAEQAQQQAQQPVLLTGQDGVPQVASSEQLARARVANTGQAMAAGAAGPSAAVASGERGADGDPPGGGAAGAGVGASVPMPSPTIPASVNSTTLARPGTAGPAATGSPALIGTEHATSTGAATQHATLQLKQGSPDAGGAAAGSAMAEDDAHDALSAFAVDSVLSTPSMPVVGQAGADANGCGRVLVAEADGLGAGGAGDTMRGAAGPVLPGPNPAGSQQGLGQGLVEAAAGHAAAEPVPRAQQHIAADRLGPAMHPPMAGSGPGAPNAPLPAHQGAQGATEAADGRVNARAMALSAAQAIPLLVPDSAPWLSQQVAMPRLLQLQQPQSILQSEPPPSWIAREMHRLVAPFSSSPAASLPAAPAQPTAFPNASAAPAGSPAPSAPLLLHAVPHPADAGGDIIPGMQQYLNSSSCQSGSQVRAAAEPGEGEDGHGDQRCPAKRRKVIYRA